MRKSVVLPTLAVVAVVGTPGCGSQPLPKVIVLGLDGAFAAHRCRGPNWPSVGSAQQNHGSVSLGGRFLCLDGAGETRGGIRLP